MTEHKSDPFAFLLALALIFLLAWRLAKLQARVDVIEKAMVVDAGTP